MRYSRKSAGILSLLLLFNSIGMNACGQATAETGHVSISMTGMENTPVINYTMCWWISRGMPRSVKNRQW